ncbi:MAG: 30S ribosomal protein S6 [Acidobacteria bacterium]|nr:30S ribosomal protein S6 [Acidobacteriota bacterium]
MRIYEELFIVRPDATDEEIDPLVEQLKTVITTAKGTVDKVDKWGVRKLAYKVKKRAEGNYILIQFSSEPEAVKELERRLRVSDLVIKFITVRQDEKMKMDAKMRKKREARAARKPVVQTVTPGIVMPSEPSAAVPGAPAEPAAAPAPAVPAAPAPAAPEAAAPAAETVAAPEVKE